LDAFPVYRALYTQGVWQEIYVEWDNTNGRFKDKRVPLKQGPLLEYINEERIEPEEGQFIEINLDAPQWLRKVAGQLTDGQIITIDYGDVGEELYAAHRLNGTFRCYRNHRAYHDPYLFPGNQDMTSHVNFSACIRAVLGTGFDSRLMTQKQFLLECGILDRLQNHEALDPFSPVSRRNRAIRQLLLSDGMSELFKVLIQTKKR
jgi:SAM-dependent MidA family methyltransferase